MQHFANSNIHKIILFYFSERLLFPPLPWFYPMKEGNCKPCDQFGCIWNKHLQNAQISQGSLYLLHLLRANEKTEDPYPSVLFDGANAPLSSQQMCLMSMLLHSIQVHKQLIIQFIKETVFPVCKKPLFVELQAHKEEKNIHKHTTKPVCTSNLNSIKGNNTPFLLSD